LLSTGFPSHKRHCQPQYPLLPAADLRSHGVRRAGAAALDLAYCAAGRVDGFWEFNLKPWDTAAGALLVQEAGGAMIRFDGSPFRLDSQEILATNGLLTDEILSFFADMFAGRQISTLCPLRRSSPRGAWSGNRVFPEVPSPNQAALRYDSFCSISPALCLLFPAATIWLDSFGFWRTAFMTY